MLLLTIVEKLPERVSDEEILGKEADQLILTSDQRRWTRGRFVTGKKRDVALALPTGTQLEPGQIIWVGPQWYIAVAAAPEPLLLIHPRDQQEAIRIAFDVGNRHFPLACEGDRLLVPDDPAMTQMLDRLNVRWERYSGAFQPIGKALRHEE